MLFLVEHNEVPRPSDYVFVNEHAATPNEGLLRELLDTHPDLVRAINEVSIEILMFRKVFAD